MEKVMTKLGLKPLMDKKKQPVITTRNALENSTLLEKKLSSLTEVMTAWGQPPYNSIASIRELHKRLFKDDPKYKSKGMIEAEPGVFRDTDLTLESEDTPPNFYAKGADVEPLMEKYCDTLDRILEDLPTVFQENGSLKEFHELADAVQHITRAASKAQYIYVRIHPFLDGNGRISRMIMQKVLQKGGLKGVDLLASYDETERTTYLDALKTLDTDHDLRPLDLYLLTNIERHYDPTLETEAPMNIALEAILVAMTNEYHPATKLRNLAPLSSIKLELSDIWKFGDIDIAQ